MPELITNVVQLLALEPRTILRSASGTALQIASDRPAIFACGTDPSYPFERALRLFGPMEVLALPRKAPKKK